MTKNFEIDKKEIIDFINSVYKDSKSSDAAIIAKKITAKTDEDFLNDRESRLCHHPFSSWKGDRTYRESDWRRRSRPGR